jgi:aryl-alcohol dehydrogenase-like predicted oxidoreductase
VTNAGDAGAMPYRALGASGLRATRLGLGMAALGRPGYITLGHAGDFGADHDPDAVRARVHRVLDAAREEGIGYIDVARSYGRAEEFLGAWLTERGIGPGEIVVGSKWGYRYTADWRAGAEVHEIKDHGVGALRRQWPESRARVGRWLALYQVHSATLESGILDDGGALEELARLRDEEGLEIGLTTSGPRQADTIRRALGVVRGGAPLFSVVQATWNPLEPSAGRALSQAHEAGVGVIVKEALANGRLAGRDAALPPVVRDALMQAVPGARSLDQAALAIALAQPFADVVLSGAATVGQVRSNARSVPLSAGADPAAAVIAGVAESPARYWMSRAGLPWN